MRWLIVKDLRLLRRSPVLLGVLVVYPVAIALVIGFALSSPPGRPKVAVLDEVPPAQRHIDLGGTRVDINAYAAELFRSIDPVPVHRRADAFAAVRDGRALAALIVPADLPGQIQNLVTQGFGTPTVELVLNTRDPLERQFVDSAIDARVSQVEQAIAGQVLQIAEGDLQRVLDGGSIKLLGGSIPLLGLKNSRTIVDGAIAALPARSPLRAALAQVSQFAATAIEGLSFSRPVLTSIVAPLTLRRTSLPGRTTPADSYAVAIAVVVSLMLICLLLASGLLAAEREENTWSRLTRGLVGPSKLILGKLLVTAGLAAAVGLAMSAGISAFVALEWNRVALWCVALAAGAVAFAALGLAIGALAGEVRAASLLAFLFALPVAFIALVPGDTVSAGVGAVLDALSFGLPFRAALQAATNAFSGAAPGLGAPLAHLAVLTVLFGAVARLATRRFT